MADADGESKASLVRRRIWVGVALSVLLALAGWRLSTLRLDHSLELMLPARSEAMESVRILRSGDVGAGVVLSFSADDAALSFDDLRAAVDDYVARLDPGLLSAAGEALSVDELMAEAGFFYEYAPLMFTASDQAAFEEKLRPEAIDRALKRRLMDLMRLEGAFMSSMVESDPLEIRGFALGNVRGLFGSMGYDVTVQDGVLVSRDGRHIMQALESTVPFTDAGGAHLVVDHLAELEAGLPAGISVDAICGHLHTVGNARAIHRDIFVTMSIAGAFFMVLFLAVFRDVTAGAIFLIPAGALLLAANVAGFFIDSLSQMILGLGGVVAGIAVDYAIHVYVAARSTDDRAAALRHVRRPVLLGAITTGGMFLAFTFSTIPGYQQLGTFALISVSFSLLGALFVLPVFVRVGRMAAPRLPGVLRDTLPSRAVLMSFVGFLALALLLARGATVNSDMLALDGAGDEVFAAEERFGEVWGKGQAGQALIVCEAESYDAALAVNDQVERQARAQLGEGQLLNIGRVWGSAERRAANRARWQAFWSRDRMQRLETDLAAASEATGFAEDAFAPFLDAIRSSAADDRDARLEDSSILTRLSERFAADADVGAVVLSYFSDAPEQVAVLRAITDGVDGARVISRAEFSEALSGEYVEEVLGIGTIATVLVVLVCLLLWRSLRLTIVALLPVVAALSAIVGMSGALGIPLNAMSLVAGIVVIGLCIDYGIFVAYARAHGLDLGTRRAVGLSAATTLIGSGAMLFARHPALLSVGQTLFVGVLAGYIVAVCVVPVACERLGKVRTA